MFPAILDLSVLKVAVVGGGPAAVRRIHSLEKAGARTMRVFSTAPESELKIAAGSRLESRLPEESEIADLHLVFTAGLPDADARRMAVWARRHGTLVNTEDVRSLCDFHVPAMVRRGDLLFTVSTAGKSPGLARRLRRELESSFGPEWAARLEELCREREGWRSGGVPLRELTRRTDALIAAKGWF